MICFVARSCFKQKRNKGIVLIPNYFSFCVFLDLKKKINPIIRLSKLINISLFNSSKGSFIVL